MSSILCVRSSSGEPLAMVRVEAIASASVENVRFVHISFMHATPVTLKFETSQEALTVVREIYNAMLSAL